MAEQFGRRLDLGHHRSLRIQHGAAQDGPIQAGQAGQFGDNLHHGGVRVDHRGGDKDAPGLDMDVPAGAQPDMAVDAGAANTSAVGLGGVVGDHAERVFLPINQVWGEIDDEAGIAVGLETQRAGC